MRTASEGRTFGGLGCAISGVLFRAMANFIPRFAKTKIVCTAGPACEDVDVLAALVRAGADVVRVNGAHCSQKDLKTWVGRMRRVRRETGYPAGLMVDLPGIKLRTGKFRDTDAIDLEVGSVVQVFPGTEGGSPTRIPVDPWPESKGLQKGGAVLLDDGRLRLRIERRRGDVIWARVEQGGLLQERKGVAFPGVMLPLDVPTRRDRALARAAIKAGADWLCQSFVQGPRDILRLKSLARRAGVPDMPVCAKIERADAFERLEEILVAADACIVARGDLGVDVGPENVPALQKRIIATALRVGCPVIVATEMLDSMTTRERPTRAEVSDVAGAVYEGTDAVMLSGETAVGDHPVLAVQTMNRILMSAEADPNALYAGSERLPAPEHDPDRCDQHVVHAAVTLAQETGARALVVFSRSGATILRTSKERPRALIHGFTPTDETTRRLTLAWGVAPQRLPAGRSTDELVKNVLKQLRETKHLRPGERAVLVTGGTHDPVGATTMIKLLTV